MFYIVGRLGKFGSQWWPWFAVCESVNWADKCYVWDSESWRTTYAACFVFSCVMIRIVLHCFISSIHMCAFSAFFNWHWVMPRRKCLDIAGMGFYGSVFIGHVPFLMHVLTHKHTILEVIFWAELVLAGWFSSAICFYKCSLRRDSNVPVCAYINLPLIAGTPALLFLTITP